MSEAKVGSTGGARRRAKPATAFGEGTPALGQASDAQRDHAPPPARGV
ncbi:MAG: hypothetical protein JO156_01075 [Solirubrobacterales bacterium]|nr:hypothetical protein [Solirubrobacterales bacterium]